MSKRTYSSPRFLLRTAFRKLGLEVSRYRPRGAENLPRAIDPAFVALYKKYHAFTMVGWSGLHTAWRAVRHIEDADIQGDIVECGVWKAGCTAIMAEALSRTKRHFWLYDTFEGMSVPGENDYSLFTNIKAADLYEDFKGDWSVGTEEGVMHVLAMTGKPEKNFKLVKGKVEDTIPATMPSKVALLRLDTDWYESTKHELTHLYPKLVNGGILIVDDYGAWAGSKQAVDEFFADPSRKKEIFFQYDPLTGNICGVKRS